MAFAGRVLVLSSLALALAACGGGNKSGVPKGAPGELSSFAKEWPAPNQDLANRRVATSKINSGNVSQLGVAWTIPIQGGGTFGTTRRPRLSPTASSTRRI